MNLLADHNLPFAVALALMVLLALFQAFGLGGSFGDSDLDADSDGHAYVADGLLLAFGLGRVPFMIWLATLLLLFAGLGVGIQSIAEGLIGAPLDMWLGAVLAGVVALPATGVVARPLARILPRDETTAVGLDSLVGRRATIMTGRAAAGHPARAQVNDRFGHPHHVMVEPHEMDSQMLEGDEVLLVRRDGETFFGVPLQERRLAPM